MSAGEWFGYTVAAVLMVAVLVHAIRARMPWQIPAGVAVTLVLLAVSVAVALAGGGAHHG